MKTNLIIIAIAALTMLFSCDKEEESPVIPKTEMLAGTTQRSWYRHSITPTPEDGVCNSSADDSWIFFPDGSFEYNHGTITLDETNGCGDFVNYIGTWELTNNQTHIKVVSEHEKGDPSNTFVYTVMDGELSMLDNEKFVVVATDPSTNIEYSIEYRRR